MNKRRIVARLFVPLLAALAFTMMLCGKATAFDGELSLEKIRSMHYNGPLPEIGKLSPATQIDLVPPENAEYNTAYRNRDRCAIFFVAMDKVKHDLSFSWNGPACNDKLVSGAGVLQIQYKTDTPKGTVTDVRILKGNFSGGYLAGEGSKYNLRFDANGKMVDDTYESFGQFSHSLLDGTGTRIWYGTTSAQPSLKVISGNFKNGDTTEGRSIISMLHPYPGAEAVSHQVVYSDKGDEKFYAYQDYKNKGEIKGKIWFPGADEAWDTQIHELAEGYQLKNALFIRGEQGQVMTGCDGWQSGTEGWRCEVDNKTKFLFVSNVREGLENDGVVSASSFILDLALINKTNPFRFLSERASAETGWGFNFWFGALLKGKQEPANSICNSSITSCEYSKLKKVGSEEIRWRLFRDSREWKNEKWQSLSGSTADATENGNVTFVDSRCSQYSSSKSSTCLSGEVFFHNGGKWTGGYKLMYSGGYPDPEGYGRVTFAGGKWAEGTKGTKGEAGSSEYGSTWISLSRCGNDYGNLECKLENDTVVFISR